MKLQLQDIGFHQYSFQFFAFAAAAAASSAVKASSVSWRRGTARGRQHDPPTNKCEPYELNA
jgi:hypothetical protein